MKSKIFFILFSLVFALTAGCSNSGSGSEEGTSNGTLVLNLSMDQNPDGPSYTLLPDIDMTPASYLVTGTGPNGATFSESTVLETLEITDLAFGEWNVLVEASNAAAILIASGTAIAAVHSNSTTTTNITVRPIAGTGTLNLTVNWIAANVEVPSITAQLIPFAGAPIDLVFVMGSGTATYSNAAVPTGYYTLVVKLLDNGAVVIGAVEVVRIVNGAITTGIYDFTTINTPNGTIIINITPEMDDPLIVTTSGQVAAILPTESMSVTASVAEFPEGVTYVWYMNGASIGTGATYTVPIGTELGFYRLDVIAFTIDGTRAGSASNTFSVVETL